MKRWIHSDKIANSTKLPKVKSNIAANTNSNRAHNAFLEFKKRFPKAYEVLGK